LNREEGDCRSVARPHHCEVLVIQRCDLGELQAFGDGDHRHRIRRNMGLGRLAAPVR